jgi:NodT family efflux transporter outer membrane factor (OMF) lipoprotein
LRIVHALRHAAASVLAATLLAACVVGPDYEKPKPDADAQWAQRLPGTEPVEATTPWWQAFHDPLLDELVERAAAANAGLQRARAAIGEARAAVVQARGGGMPQLNATTSALSTKQYSPPVYTPVESYGTAGFDASWEVELWGKTDRAVEAAEANAEGAEATAADAMVTLLGDVARTYAELRGLQAQLAAANVSVENQMHDTEMARLRQKGGDGTKLEILQGQASLAAAQSLVPPLQAEIRARIDALSVLCGEPPYALAEQLRPSAPIPTADLPRLGVPADLVRRRPDVRVAERAIATSVAQVGVAIANQLPTLSLDGNVALSGASLAKIMAAPIFAVGPTLSVPVFDGGVKAAQVDIQKSRVEQARWGYRDAVLKALQEVEDALARMQGEQARRATLIEAERIAAEQLATAQILYRNGDDGFFQILSAQHALDDARSQLAQSETALATDIVAIFKALGGGWEVEHERKPIAPDAPFAPVPEAPSINAAPPLEGIGLPLRRTDRTVPQPPKAPAGPATL